MTPAYRPLPEVAQSHRARSDAGVRAAALVLFQPLPPSSVPPRPWWIGFLRGIGTLCFMVAILALFVLGAVMVLRIVKGPYAIVALLAYGIACGWLMRKARL